MVKAGGSAFCRKDIRIIFGIAGESGFVYGSFGIEWEKMP
jgi:hypothetical protein